MAFLLLSGGAAIDFNENTYNLATSESAHLPISNKTKRLRLIQSVKAGSADVCFLVLGIEFLQVVGEAGAPSKIAPSHNALAVVRVVSSAPSTFL